MQADRCIPISLAETAGLSHGPYYAGAYLFCDTRRNKRYVRIPFISYERHDPNDSSTREGWDNYLYKMAAEAVALELGRTPTEPEVRRWLKANQEMAQKQLAQSE